MPLDLCPKATSATRAPALFVPHGGGPLPVLNDPSHAGLIKFLKSTAQQYISNRPKAIILVTAHWETKHPTISSGEKYDLMYDYGGFPDEAYKLKFPAHGDPAVAKRAHHLLQEAGLNPRLDETREWDHGVFVPLLLLTPKADIPVVQMSVLASQDAKVHFQIGKALEPLRDEGVAIIGSGMSYHNMREMRSSFDSPGAEPKNLQFDEALMEACTASSPEDREKKLVAWENMYGSRNAHPSGAAEHLMPLIVTAGAGGTSKGQRVLTWDTWALRFGAYLW